MDSLNPRPLSESYYAECNQVFRAATNQSDRMLEAVWRVCRGRRELKMLSVGCGTGLFELPMLDGMRRRSISLEGFEGIDISLHACGEFREALMELFNRQFKWTVSQTSFEDFKSEASFDYLLFNHVFEYFGRPSFQWIQKALNLLSPEGSVLLFSPQRGGINTVYENSQRKMHGNPPLFADDIQQALEENQVLYEIEIIEAECNISVLDEPPTNPEKLDLLSFLTQSDTRDLPQNEINELAVYYQSLTPESQPLIPHPTTLFILHPAS